MNNNSNLLPDSVKLIKVDVNGQTVSELNQLFDDGNVSTHGDEIQSDNVFSTKQNFNETTQGQLNFRISAKTSDSPDVWLSPVF